MATTGGIGDFALGERVRFAHQPSAAIKVSASGYVEGVVVSINIDVGTIDVEIDIGSGRSQRLIKRPWDLQKVGSDVPRKPPPTSGP
jgi:hypothetical protein